MIWKSKWYSILPIGNQTFTSLSCFLKEMQASRNCFLFSSLLHNGSTLHMLWILLFSPNIFCFYIRTSGSSSLFFFSLTCPFQCTLGLFLSLAVTNKLHWVASYAGFLVCVQANLKDKVPEVGLPGQRVNAFIFLINITKLYSIEVTPFYTSINNTYFLTAAQVARIIQLWYFCQSGG